MSTFTPPARSGVPPVLPPWSGREAQTITSYKLFRHYRSRPEGINVFELSDGTITEDDPDGTAVVWSPGDRTGDSIDALYVVTAWYGGHDDYVLTDAQETALTDAGYGPYITP